MTPPDGQKFLSHQFTFLEPSIFLDLQMNLPATSLKPAFLSHQCLWALSRTTKQGRRFKLAFKLEFEFEFESRIYDTFNLPPLTNSLTGSPHQGDGNFFFLLKKSHEGIQDLGKCTVCRQAFTDDEIDMVVTLRINRDFMQHMRLYYPEVIKSTHPHTAPSSRRKTSSIRTPQTMWIPRICTRV